MPAGTVGDVRGMKDLLTQLEKKVEHHMKETQEFLEEELDIAAIEVTVQIRVANKRRRTHKIAKRISVVAATAGIVARLINNTRTNSHHQDNNECNFN